MRSITLPGPTRYQVKEKLPSEWATEHRRNQQKNHSHPALALLRELLPMSSHQLVSPRTLRQEGNEATRQEMKLLPSSALVATA